MDGPKTLTLAAFALLLGCIGRTEVNYEGTFSGQWTSADLEATVDGAVLGYEQLRFEHGVQRGNLRRFLVPLALGALATEGCVEAARGVLLIESEEWTVEARRCCDREASRATVFAMPDAIPESRWWTLEELIWARGAARTWDWEESDDRLVGVLTVDLQLQYPADTTTCAGRFVRDWNDIPFDAGTLRVEFAFDPDGREVHWEEASLSPPTICC